MSSPSEEIFENLACVRERIKLAASRAGRSADEITLVAVSKTHSARKIQAVYEGGVRHFGENRVQEREAKLAQLKGIDATWHMIGHLQKNKVARVVRVFDAIDSVDSIALAEKLDRAWKDLAAEGTEPKQARTSELGLHRHAPFSRLPLLIEVKLDPEPSKTGLNEAELASVVEAVERLPNIELRGLMGIPPYSENPEEARPHFRRLRELREGVRARKSRQILPVLSMGMSHDFEIAIEEGATEIRVGTALFGARGTA